jgi:hypothetical protein
MLLKENGDLRTRIKYVSEAMEAEQLAKKAREDGDVLSNSSFNFSSKIGGSTTKGAVGVTVGKKIEDINK